MLDRLDYLAHLGAYGSLVAAIQCTLLERDALRAAWASAAAAAATPGGLARMLGLEAAFVASLCSFYMLTALLMERGSSATAMNLSLLTSDFWSVAVGIGLLHSHVGLWYARPTLYPCTLPPRP